eukprot:scaffold17352_cov83-Isochrysis_galbana.AAC.1
MHHLQVQPPTAGSPSSAFAATVAVAVASMAAVAVAPRLQPSATPDLAMHGIGIGIGWLPGRLPALELERRLAAHGAWPWQPL